MNDYFVDLKAERIHVPDSRWYEIGDYEREGIAYPSVTSILKMKRSDGLEAWKIKVAMSGLDPKEIGKAAMDSGSTVHNAAELLMNGNELEYSEEYDFWGEWMPIMRFKQAFETLSIKPVMIEQTIWSNEMKCAGTLDLLCNLIPKGRKTHTLAIVDLKRSAQASTDYQWQIITYKRMLLEMIKSPDKHSKEIIPWLCDKLELTEEKLIKEVGDMKAYILLLNTPTKAGWRLTEVQDTPDKHDGFNFCNGLFRTVYPNLSYVKKIYPTKIKL